MPLFPKKWIRQVGCYLYLLVALTCPCVTQWANEGMNPKRKELDTSLWTTIVQQNDYVNYNQNQAYL